MTVEQEQVSKLVKDWMDKPESRMNHIGRESLRTLAAMILELLTKR